MKFSNELAESILDRIADGESLRAICKDKNYPSRQTVLRWLWGENEEANVFGFVAKYARAREAQGDLMDDRILEEAEKVTSETAQAVRVRVDAFKWRASKLRPKVYGDKLDATHNVNVTGAELSNAAIDKLAAIVGTAIPTAETSVDQEPNG